MTKRFFPLLLLLALSPLVAQDTPAKKGTVCWPLSFAGVTVGVTNDSQLQRLLGKGVFRADEGHTGGRYYVDPKSEYTFHVEEGVGYVVESVTVSKGTPRNLRPEERSGAVSKWFDPLEGFGNWHQLKLGATIDEVRKNLGEPKEKRHRGTTWVYESTCSCELVAELAVTFRDGRVVELALSEEE